MAYPTSADTDAALTAAAPSVAFAAIEALEAKVGTGASTPTAGTVLAGTGTGTSAWSTVSGTGFPGSPTTSDRFYRTDLGIEYVWDGTRWLSTTYYTEILTSNVEVAASRDERPPAPFAGLHNLWLVSADCSFFINGGTALSASHKWVIRVQSLPAGSTLATFTIDSGALSTWRNYGAVAIGALFGLTNFLFQLDWAKTGTPGDFIGGVRVNYRLVGA